MALAEYMYRKYARVAYKVAGRFARRHGEDAEEVAGEALYHFMVAVRGKKPEGLGWSTWIYRSVWKGLQLGLRNRLRRAGRVKFSGLAEAGEAVAVRDKEFSASLLLEDLSEDGREVVGLVLGGKVENRNGLVRLLQEVGWVAGRIAESFIEIARALR